MNDSDTGQIGVVDPIATNVAPPVVVVVPNVAEGRDAWVLRDLEQAIVRPGVRVMDVHSDEDHNRSVFSVAGHPLAVQDAMVDLAGAAMDSIDVRRRQGVHPMIGALDVVPIVAREPDDMPLAAELATSIATRIGSELMLPVFRYGEIATDLSRTRPHDFRAGGIDGLTARIEDGILVPDDGPARMHATAGAVLVGARDPLIALNVWLADGGLDHARAIAARIRESGGGLPGVRALGLYLASAGAAQVSMNLEDFRRTPPSVVVAAVRREAERVGAVAGDSELVGLIPREAIVGVSPTALGLRGFRPGQVLESQLPRPSVPIDL